MPARVAADGAGLVVYSKGKIGRCAPPFNEAFAGRSTGWEAPPVESPFVRWSGGLAALTTKGTMALVAPLASQAPQYVFIAHYWQFRSLAAAGRAFLVATSACLHAFELLGDLDDEGPRVEPLWRLPSEHPEMRSHGQGAQRAYTQALWLAPGLALFGTEALGWFTYDGSEVRRVELAAGRAVHGVGHSFETGSALFAAVHEGVCVCDPKTLRASHVVPWPCDLVSLPRQRFRPDTVDAVYSFSPSGDRVFVAHPYRGAMVLDARTGALHATTVFTDAIDGVDSVDWIDERTVALHTPTALYAIDVDALP